MLPGCSVRARYSRRLGRVVVSLDSGLELMFTPALAQGLENASAEELSVIEITPSGDGLHWPALDADVWVPGLLAGQFGSKRWAAELGASGAWKPADLSSVSLRENGRMGGWGRRTAD